MPATIIDRIVPDGDAAVDYTVRGPMCWLAVRDAAHPCVQALARRLSAGARSPVEAIRRAFAHVVDTIPYEPDPEDREEVTAPIYTLGCVLPYRGYRPHGDCDCQSTALFALLLAMGHDPTFRVVAWRKPDYTHVNVVVMLPDGTSIPLDAVMKYDGWGRQRPARFREKFYRCPMKIRALADGPYAPMASPVPAPSGQAPSGPGGTTSGCGCARCRSGGNCGRSRCCPRNAATSTGSPVTVNVNTGTIANDERRWVDASERAEIRTDASRWARFPAGGAMHEERPPLPNGGRTTARPIVRATVRNIVGRPPVFRVTQPKPGRPVVLRQVPERRPLARFKEFT